MNAERDKERAKKDLKLELEIHQASASTGAANLDG